MPTIHNDRGFRLIHEPDVNAAYHATTLGERTEDALIEAERLADCVYDVSRWDADKAESRVGAIERCNAAILAALRALEAA